MKELIAYIAKALVDFPDQVSVNEVEGNQTSVLELKVAQRGFGKGYRKARQNSPGNADNIKCCVRKDQETDRPRDY